MYKNLKFKILKGTFITFLLLSLFSYGQGTKVKTKKSPPNVLFIILDDLNDAVQGMGGHPQTYTPYMSKLIKKGILFLNAQSNAPLCSPSRSSLWTGIYPHKSGILGYDQNHYTWRDSPVLKEAKTIFELFAENGYQIYATGKIFHNNHHTPELIRRLGGADAFGIGPSFGPFPWNGTAKSRFVSTHPDMVKPWGLNVFETFAPLSSVPRIPENSELGIKGYDGWVDLGKPFKFNNRNDRDLMGDEKSRDWAISKLNEAHQKPFMLTVGITRPHSPWIAPDEFFDLHPLEDIQFPPYLKGDLEDCSPTAPGLPGEISPLAHSRFHRLMKAYPDKMGWKRWIQAYLACTSYADYQIGKILEALENSEYAKNTIVVLTSDHGFHMGEKDLLFKNTIWEESARIPLIIKPLDRENWGATVQHPVSLIDMYPTLIELCGLPENPNANGNKVSLDGHSLVPFLKDPTTLEWDGPQVALSAVAGTSNVKIGDILPVEEQNYSVRSERYRYCRWENGFEELYDHKLDPNEWKNLAQEPSYKDILLKLKIQMENLLMSGN